MKAELPEENIEYVMDDGAVKVSYRYKDKKHLNIELKYKGGVKSIEIIEKGKNVQSKITYSLY